MSGAVTTTNSSPGKETRAPARIGVSASGGQAPSIPPGSRLTGRSGRDRAGVGGESDPGARVSFPLPVGRASGHPPPDGAGVPSPTPYPREEKEEKIQEVPGRTQKRRKRRDSSIWGLNPV